MSCELIVNALAEALLTASFQIHAQKEDNYA